MPDRSLSRDAVGMNRSSRRILQLAGTMLAGTAFVAVLFIGHHEPESRMWKTAASITVTLAEKIRGKSITPAAVVDLLPGDAR